MICVFYVFRIHFTLLIPLLNLLDYIINKYLPEDYTKELFFFNFRPYFQLQICDFFRRLSFSCVHNRTPREENFGHFFVGALSTPARNCFEKTNKNRPPALKYTFLWVFWVKMLPFIHIFGDFLDQNAAIYTHFWNLIFSEKTKKKKP